MILNMRRRTWKGTSMSKTKFIDFAKSKGWSADYDSKQGKYRLTYENDFVNASLKSTKEGCYELLKAYFMETKNVEKLGELTSENGYPRVYEYLSSYAKKEKEAKKKEFLKNLHSRGGIDFKPMDDPSNYVLLKHLYGKSNDVLLDLRTHELSGLNIKNFEETYIKRYNLKARAAEEKMISSVEYGQYSLFTSFHDPKPDANSFTMEEENHTQWLNVNTFIRPAWMKDYSDERENAEVPELIKRYINHLFLGNEATIERIYDWFANCLFFRDPIMLCLVSPGEGVGKSLLINLIGALHSEGRYFPAPTDVLTGVFNHSLHGKSLVLFDELKATGVARENIRKLIGNETTTRRMNHDEGVKLDQPMSYACTSNKPSDIGIEGRGRRYFVPNISGDRLNTAFTAEEITMLGRYTKAFKPQEKEESVKREMARFAWFLYKRFEEGVVCSQSELEDIKPLNFWNCQQACMPNWKSFIIDWFMNDCDPSNDNTKTLSDLRSNLEHMGKIPPRYLPNYHTLADFIETHEWRGSYLAKLDTNAKLKDSRILPIVHKGFEFEKSVYDNEIEEDLL